MRIIAVTGRIGSGKDAVAEYLQDLHGLPHLSAGDIARDVARMRGCELSRETLQEISNELLQRHGHGYFMRRLLDRARKRRLRTAVLSGVRSQEDVENLRAEAGGDMLLVAVTVSDPKTRFERLRSRGGPRDPKTFEQFLAQEREEEERFGTSVAVKLADVVLANDGTLDDLYRSVEDRVVRGWLKKAA